MKVILADAVEVMEKKINPIEDFIENSKKKLHELFRQLEKLSKVLNKASIDKKNKLYRRNIRAIKNQEERSRQSIQEEIDRIKTELAIHNI
jgi:hypothetical protein